MSYPLLRSLLFRLDAESAHELAAGLMERSASVPPLLALVESRYRRATPLLPLRRWGIDFPNPVGIAAGFDKDARLVPLLEALGFGFVEIGTVTLRPQGGNPRPRLFRSPADRALVNRMGFNNEGADVVGSRLAALRRAGGVSVPLLVNIGKNRDVAPEDAARAYAACYDRLAPFADGVVVNVSSPNTPGLRDLQRPEQLAGIVGLLRERREVARFESGGEHPIVVKIAPDLSEGQLGEIAEVCREACDGMIATNTTLAREGWSGASEGGGLSGAPLFERSTAVLLELRRIVGNAYPLIGVGGIMTADDAAAKLEAGADLVQTYTGFVYGGPGFAREVVGGLAARRAVRGTA
jgi:dihydroorotate dehydrogenase